VLYLKSEYEQHFLLCYFDKNADIRATKHVDPRTHPTRHHRTLLLFVDNCSKLFRMTLERHLVEMAVLVFII